MIQSMDEGDYMVGPGMTMFIPGDIVTSRSASPSAALLPPVYSVAVWLDRVCLYCERMNPQGRFQCEGCGASLHKKI